MSLQNDQPTNKSDVAVDLTYERLENRANEVAQGLTALGSSLRVLIPPLFFTIEIFCSLFSFLSHA